MSVARLKRAKRCGFYLIIRKRQTTFSAVRPGCRPGKAVRRQSPDRRLKGGRKMEHVEYGFGQHLMLDGYGCDRDKLVDLNGIYDFLSRYPDEIQMTKIMPPYVFKYSGKVPEDWGISGFVLIAESHISIHTFPDKLYLSLDIFSCKAFDANLAIRHIKDIFSIEKMEIKLLNRGHEFPRIIRSVQQFIKNERSQMRL